MELEKILDAALVLIPAIVVILNLIFGKGQIIKWLKSPAGQTTTKIAETVFDAIEALKNEYEEKNRGSKTPASVLKKTIINKAKEAIKDEGYRASAKTVEKVIKKATEKHTAAKRAAKRKAEETVRQLEDTVKKEARSAVQDVVKSLKL